jgi:hypothetical protein
VLYLLSYVGLKALSSSRHKQTFSCSIKPLFQRILMERETGLEPATLSLEG